MIITPIKNSWGVTVEFDNPMDFFSQPHNFWRDLLYEKKLVILKKMSFTLADYAQLGYSFGKPWSIADYKYSHEVPVIVPANGKELVVTEFSNKIHPEHKIRSEEMPWHSDIPNRRINPFPHRSLWIVKNPNPENSGKTKWLNIEDGIDYLTPEMKELLPRVKILQQSWYSPGTDEQLHDFVKVHPVTGKQSLRLNYYRTEKHKGAWIKEVFIDGVKQPDCSLIKNFINHLIQFPELIYHHQWDDFDIAVYDNWSFVHGRSALNVKQGDQVAERKFHRMNIDHLSDDAWKNQNI